jgi:membrane protein
MGKKLLSLLKETAKEWKKENPLFLGAGISFYVILSLGPILVIMIFLIGSIFSEGQAINELTKQMENVVGEKPSQVIKDLIEKASSASNKGITIISSIPLIFFGSTMIFLQLKYALNVIFEYRDGKKDTIGHMVRKYSFSFLMLLVVASVFLLLVLKNPILNILKDQLSEIIPIPWFLFRIVEVIFSFALLVYLFMMIYKILPDKKMEKKHIFYGALVTSVLFIIVQYLVGINAENTNIGNAFGAIGSFTILILWIFYSSLVFLFGAAFTKVISKGTKKS